MNKKSNYLISSDRSSLSRRPRIRREAPVELGTEFCVYDEGLNPNDTLAGDDKSATLGEHDEEDTDSEPSEARGSACAMNLPSRCTRQTSSSREPSSNEGLCPHRQLAQRTLCLPAEREGGSMIDKFKAKEMDKLFYMINKPPRWNDSVGAYAQHGRVTMAMSKTFN